MGQLRVSVTVVQKEGALEYIIVCPLLFPSSTTPTHGITNPRRQPSSRISINMLYSTFLTLSALAGNAAAHYKLLAPAWRGDSFVEPADQWIFPCTYPIPHYLLFQNPSIQQSPPLPTCSPTYVLTNPPGANINETSSMSNRTQWPVTGGSVSINGSHAHALTYVNLGLGTNVTNFNITLVDNLNQTGAGEFCLKNAGQAALEAGLKAAGYSGFDDKRLDGLPASVQVVQLGHSGSALYNVSSFQIVLVIGGGGSIETCRIQQG